MSKVVELKNNTTDKMTCFESPPQGSNVPYLVVLSGETTGKVIRLNLSSTMTLGRVRGCGLHFDDHNVSRKHACFEINEKGVTSLCDLKSTNGTLVNGKRINQVVLEDGDRICMGNLVLRYCLKDDFEYEFQQSLFNKASKDYLTGIYNRSYFMEAFAREFDHHLEQRLPLSLILFDLDDFKRVNDSYGHDNGDIVLKSIAEEVSACLRTSDLLARYGGEEFIAYFKETRREDALKIAEKIRQTVKSITFSAASVDFRVTITIGLVCFEGGNYGSMEAMIREADDCLYRGKEEGKNRIVG